MAGRHHRKYEIHVVPSTHWDREWLTCFPENRHRMMAMLDFTIDLLERDRKVKSFTLDGQVMVVDDYLELRPENRQRLTRLVKAGRLLIGPWYSLPDMPVLQGECTVRNLLYGITRARQYGGAMMACHTNSSWGQISQMPQICRGFGMDTHFSYHGVPAHRLPVEFWWEGADGSRVLFIRPSVIGKSRMFTSEEESTRPNRDAPGGPLDFGQVLPGNIYRLADMPLTDDTPFYGDDTDYPVNYDVLHDVFKGFCDKAATDRSTPNILMGEFRDGGMPHPMLSAMVEHLRKRNTTDDIHFSSIPEYFRSVRASIGKLKVVKGEMRVPGKNDFHCLMASPLASRLYIKQLNRAAEHSLMNWAEPFAAFAWLRGSDYPGETFSHAWRMMLTNHSHDDIGGCSIDNVHEDMTWRYRQICQLGRAVLHRSLGHLTRMIGSREITDTQFRIVVFNPLSSPRCEVVEAYLHVPLELPTGALAVLDQDDRPLPCCITEAPRKVKVPAMLPMDGYIYQTPDSHLVKVAIECRDIPPLGYAEYKVVPAARVPHEGPSVSAGANWMENEFLKVTVKPNGTIDLLDKGTGEKFKGLHYFQDAGQTRTHMNNAWSYVPPKHDTILTSLGGKAKVKLIHRSPVQAQLRVEYDFRVPQRLDVKGGRRSKKLVRLSIVSVLTLAKGAGRLDVQTSLNNRAMDHRLRVMFPTDVETKYSWADSPFDVVRRTIARPGAPDWLEFRAIAPVKTCPMLSFVDLAGPSRSLTIIADGLTEYEAVDDRRRTVALTLLRAFIHGYIDPTTPAPPVQGSQALGPCSVRYAIYPHKGNWDRAGVMNQAQCHNLPLKAVQAMGAGAGELPARGSFLRFTAGELTVTAVKKAQDGDDLIIRLVNTTGRTVRTKLVCGFDVKAAKLVNMLEDPLPSGSLKVQKGNEIPLTVKPKKILTLRLTTGRC